MLALSGQLALAQPAQDLSASDYLQSTEALAGDAWRTSFEFLCGPDPDPGNSAESPVMTPTRIFDNLYAFGRSGAVVYAIPTSEGIVLIDSGYPDQVDTVLAPGLRELGLNADDVRYVIVAHGHRDHYGGSRHMQQEHGSSVVLSAADWDFVEQYRGEPATEPPERDIVAENGEAIVLGETSITPVLVPGHTPGALGLIFGVRDGASTHTAGLFGGTILISSRIPDEGLQQYIDSLDRFAEIAYEMGVDVEIQNHPVMDDTHAKIDQLAGRRSGEPHPFVVGRDAYRDFLGVIAGCTRAELARRSVQ